ncbi:MAG: hypothetical protein LBQ86_04570 [Holophagales bacterium]|nr:hypothetical protein [Holophagales bacterium]
MKYRCWAPGSVITTIACLIAIGCSGDETDDGKINVQNRPPVIVKDSLTWSPAHDQISLYTPYTYSIRAADPDIGDAVVRYEWLFGNSETGGERYETTISSVTHAFDASSVATLSVRATDRNGAAGQYEVFTIPLASDTSDFPLLLTAVEPSQPLNFRLDPGGSVVVPFEFTITDEDDAPVSVARFFFDPGETAASFSPQPAEISPTHFKLEATYNGSTQSPNRTLSPSLSVEDTSGRRSNRITFPDINIQTVTTPNRPPQISITEPATLTPVAYTSKPVTLSFTVIDLDNDTVNYTIDWGDGTAPDIGIVSNTATGAQVMRQHAFHDAFTNTAHNSVMTVQVSDGRSTDGAVTESRTFTVVYNAYPTGTIITPQASQTLPSTAELPSNPAQGLINPPGADDADIVVIPRNGRLSFQAIAGPPGSGDAQLTYLWTFSGGTPSESTALNPGDVVFAGVDDQIVPYLVEFSVRDAFARSSINAPGVKPKTYRKWVVVDAKNSQTFNLALKYRLLPGGELVTAQTTDNGMGALLQVFQDGSSNAFAIDDGANNAEVAVPVRSNLPFWVMLPEFGTDDTNYVIRIPNAPAGEFADPSMGNWLLGGVWQLDGISRFGFQNQTNPWNPTLHIVTAQGFGIEGQELERLKSLSGFARIADGSGEQHERWVDMLALPKEYPAPLDAIQWKQSNNVVGNVSLTTNQGAPEWPTLLYSRPAKDLPPDVADNTTESGNSDNLGFMIDYPAYTADNPPDYAKTFSVLGMQAFRAPETTTDYYFLNSPPGWDSLSCVVFNNPPYTNANRPGMNPRLVGNSAAQFFSRSIFNAPGNQPLSGGISSYDLFFNPNDPNWTPAQSPYVHVGFANFRTTFSYAEYLKSPHWARPLVLNATSLYYHAVPVIATNPNIRFRYSNPPSWPKLTGISPDDSSFDITPSAGTSFDGRTVGRFYWTAYTPFYEVVGSYGGSLITRTWLADNSHLPPTTFNGGAGDATSALGFAPPLAIRVDKHSRRPDGSAIQDTYDGYRVRWYNPTRDMNGNVVPPDFWVVEFVKDGKSFHYILPPNFPNPPRTQSDTDSIVTDARVRGANGSFVDKGYCWFDIPVELRADINNPGSICYLTVFAVKFINKNNPVPTARPLHGPEWIDAVKTATATIKLISSTAGSDLSYAHKLPFNYPWDIVVVNGDRVEINP